MLVSFKAMTWGGVVWDLLGLREDGSQPGKQVSSINNVYGGFQLSGDHLDHEVYLFHWHTVN